MSSKMDYSENNNKKATNFQYLPRSFKSIQLKQMERKVIFSNGKYEDFVRAVDGTLLADLQKAVGGCIGFYRLSSEYVLVYRFSYFGSEVNTWATKVALDCTGEEKLFLGPVVFLHLRDLADFSSGEEKTDAESSSHLGF